MADLSLNRNARIDIRPMGREHQPLIIIDNALTAPDDMAGVAAHTRFIQPPHTLYPGLNAPVPPVYSQSLAKVLRPLLDEVFGIPAHIELTASSFFALATQGPADLQPVQKVPHHDSCDPFMIAMVHYLCQPPQGGTAFFRHKTTGYEYVSDERFKPYEDIMRAELTTGELPHHAGRDTPNYELIDSADMVYNRLVIYRSISLHSALLDESRLSNDPQAGRLTLNTMMAPNRA
jgi:hypothetical protein